MSDPNPIGEDMAFAGGSALLLLSANSLAPGLGGVLAAATVAGMANHRAKASAEHIARQRVMQAALEEMALAPIESAADAWGVWLPWQELCAGAKIDVPGELPHPASAGFKTTRLASNVGQVADWVRPLPDRSRLHAHEYEDGRVVVHRDVLDPDLGPGTATIHWLHETREGTGVLGALLLGGLGYLAWTVAHGQARGATTASLSGEGG